MEVYCCYAIFKFDSCIILSWDILVTSIHGIIRWKLPFHISIPLAFYITNISYILTCFHFV